MSEAVGSRVRINVDPQQGRPRNNRTKVSNRRDVLPNTDGRSYYVRRFRDIESALIADQGGLDKCSESKLQLIRRFAMTSVLAEDLEAKVARGEDIDLAVHAQFTSTLVRIANKIGVKREAKKAVPTIEEYSRLRREAAS